MIKGVNKQIVEINSTNSAFFEKAVLYVKPSMQDFSSKALAREAQHYVNNIVGTQNKKIRTLSFKTLAIAFATGCGFGVVYALSVMFLF